ncbi:MAG: pyridoxamine 5-phosphate oxidase-related FMN-binding protein [Actinomycetia bacterium]|nr:pyridoxamine 5-phosphate oxidase-related FMN-binding protein [Actinomycetes bacterium]
MEAVLAELSREKCLQLMATAQVGRIIYTRQAMPAVELVNFIVDAGDIVIRTAASGKLAAAIRGAIVAFEADEYDSATRTGWSVTAIGQAREVTDPAWIERLRTAGRHPWVPGDHPYFVRIAPGMLTGRRLTPAGTGLAGPDGGLPQ